MGYAITDRPVYRPGATVHFCIWLRRERDGVYRPAPAGAVKVKVHGAYNRQPQVVTAQVDEAGVASGAFGSR